MAQEPGAQAATKVCSLGTLIYAKCAKIRLNNADVGQTPRNRRRVNKTQIYALSLFFTPITL